MLKKYLPLIGLTIISIVLICIPFVTQNSFKTLDLQGHIFATTYMKDNLLPNLNGWNPFQNLGYPQGTHYPPLIQYVIAIISKITTIDITSLYKASIVFVILILPFSIYSFMNKINKEKHSDIVIQAISIIVFLMFVLLPSTFGGSLKALLSTGLLNNFLTIPLFFYYLTYIYEIYTTKTRFKLILILSILLSILILSHLVTGLVSAVIGGVVIILKLIKEKNLKIIIFPLLCLVLTGFYVIPYILNSRFLTGSKPILSSLPYSLGIFIIVVITLGVIYFKKKDKSTLIFVISALLVSILPLFEAISYRISGLTNLQIINAYRLLPFVFYLGVPIFLYNIANLIKISKKLEIMGTVILILVSTILIFKSSLQLKDIGSIDENKIITRTLSANYIDLYSRFDIWDYIRVPYMNLNDMKYSNYSVIGQFEESSYLNHYTVSLKNSLDLTTKRLLSSKIVYIEDMKVNEKKIDLAKDLFNIGYSVMLNENDKKNCAKLEKLQDIKTRYSDKGKFGIRNDSLYLCELLKGSFSDVDIYKDPGIFKNVSKKDWDKEVINWWTNEDSKILVEGEESLGVGTGEKIENNQRIKWGDKYQSFSINIPTSSQSWALIKVQYNPRWKAYDSNNNELTVYRVSPSLMLVKASGMVNFKYTQPLLEILGEYISLLTLISISVLLIRKKFRD